MEQAIALKSEEYDAYFWKGMLLAYYYRGRLHFEEAKMVIEQALTLGLPPVLLTPLYWFEKDNPTFFKQYAGQLLEQHEL